MIKMALLAGDDLRGHKLRLFACAMDGTLTKATLLLKLLFAYHVEANFSLIFFYDWGSKIVM